LAVSKAALTLTILPACAKNDSAMRGGGQRQFVEWAGFGGGDGARGKLRTSKEHPRNMLATC
jgi:hypothetical protein